MAKFKVGDKVRVCENIAEREDNVGFFPPSMGNYQGKVMTIKGSQGSSHGGTLYTLENCAGMFFDWVWREAWLEPVATNTKKLIVTSNGVTTTAKLIDGKQTIKTAEATCSKDDEFSFETGAQIAVDRLLGRKPAEPEKPKFTKADLKDGMFGFTESIDSTNREWFVVVNDRFVYEDGGYDPIAYMGEQLAFDRFEHDPRHQRHLGAVLAKAMSFNHAKSAYESIINTGSSVVGARILYERK